MKFSGEIRHPVDNGDCAKLTFSGDNSSFSIDGVFVPPEQREHGIERVLIGRVVALADQMEKDIHLAVRPTEGASELGMEHLISYYEDMGFNVRERGRTVVFMSRTFHRANIFDGVASSTIPAVEEDDSPKASVMAAIGDGISIQDREFRVLYQNPAHRRLAGDQTGQYCFRAYEGRESVCEKCPVERAFEDGGVHTAERSIEAGGNVRHFEITASLLRDGKGGLLGAIEVVREVTERRQALAAELDQRFRHGPKLESLRLLAGGIAHAFNNQLMVILNHADMAAARMPQESATREHIDAIQKASSKAAGLCEQMLIYAGEGRFALGQVSLSHVVSEICRTVDKSLPDGVELIFRPNCGGKAIVADPTALQQAMVNLVLNSIEAMGGRPGTISITTDVMTCDRRYLGNLIAGEKLPAGQYVYVEISDTGCGMDSGVRRRLFDPFFSTKFTGRGFGMALVLGIVRSHKGAIDLHSESGRGSTIRLLFPAEGAAHCVREPASAVPAARGHVPEDRFRVLLIEPDGTVRDAAAALLQHLGFAVRTARNSAEATERLGKTE